MVTPEIVSLQGACVRVIKSGDLEGAADLQPSKHEKCIQLLVLSGSRSPNTSNEANECFRIFCSSAEALVGGFGIGAARTCGRWGPLGRLQKDW